MCSGVNVPPLPGWWRDFLKGDLKSRCWVALLLLLEKGMFFSTERICSCGVSGEYNGRDFECGGMCEAMWRSVIWKTLYFKILLET